MTIARNIQMPIGYIFEEPDGSYTLTDKWSVFLTDEDIDKVNKHGITRKEYDETVRDKMAEVYTPTPPAEKKTVSGWVYAVRCGNKLKLGRTKDIQSRFKQYRKVTDKFEIIATAKVADYVQSEIDLMVAFGGVAGKQEWFDYTSKRHSEALEYFAKEVV